MKILIATGLYPPDIGGPATYTVFLEKHMPRFGIDLAVVPFTHVRKYPPFIRHLLYLFRLLRASKGCDVIYVLDTISVGIPGLIAHFFTRKPLMLRVPGDYAWEQGQQRFGITETLDQYLQHSKHPFPVRVLAWLQYQVARHACRIVVPSDYMKKVVSGWGIDDAKITRIYSILKSLPTPTPLPQKNENIFTVATAARLVPWKGISALIEAVSALRREGIPAELVIVGDGVLRNTLEAEAAAHGGAPAFRFTGALPREILGEELSRADAFVLNTSYEGLSHQLLEIMDLGIPIVTTPVGGNVELIEDEITGLMVPFNDVAALTGALRRLYQETPLREKLIQNAKKKVASFDESLVVEEFVSLLKTFRLDKDRAERYA